MIRAAQAGDAEAFLRLVRGCDREVMSVLYRWIGDACDREDLYQEVFLEAFRSLGRFSFRSSFHTWLYRIAFHRCVSHRRRRRTHEDVAELPDLVAESVDDERRERLRAVRKALEKLPEKQQLCFFLFYVEGWTVDEIAERIGARSGSVKTHLSRARQRIKTTEEVLKWQPIST